MGDPWEIHSSSHILLDPMLIANDSIACAVQLTPATDAGDASERMKAEQNKHDLSKVALARFLSQGDQVRHPSAVHFCRSSLPLHCLAEQRVCFLAGVTPALRGGQGILLGGKPSTTIASGNFKRLIGQLLFFMAPEPELSEDAAIEMHTQPTDQVVRAIFAKYHRSIYGSASYSESGVMLGSRVHS